MTTVAAMTNGRRGMRGALRVLVLSLAVAASPLGVVAALAKAGLENEKEIMNRILLGSITNELFTKCDRIAPRRIKAFFYVIGTFNMARRLGYSQEDIDRLRNDPAQQERLQRETDAWLRAHGVVPGKPETYCRAGFAEIRKKSEIGSYLKPE